MPRRRLVPSVPTTWLVRSLILALRPLPPSAALWLGRRIGRLIYRLLPFRLEVLRANLRRLSQFTALPPRLEGKVYEHFGQALMLSLLNPKRALRLADTATPNTTTIGSETMASFCNDCRDGGVLMCSCHVGVWELLPAVLFEHVPERSRRLGRIVYRPLHDAALDRLLLKRRTRAAGMAALADGGSMAELRDALREGGIVGLLADQRPAHEAKGGERQGIGIQLFGHACEMSPGLVALHQSTGAPVWFATLVLLDGVLRLRLERLAQRAECSASLAADYADAVTAAVAATPEQYFWFHDRWRWARSHAG